MGWVFKVKKTDASGAHTVHTAFVYTEGPMTFDRFIRAYCEGVELLIPRAAEKWRYYFFDFDGEECPLDERTFEAACVHWGCNHCRGGVVEVTREGVVVTGSHVFASVRSCQPDDDSDSD
eukprot:Polyplicarium_translucidae@DN2127_c0_g1_i2.p2